MALALAGTAGEEKELRERNQMAGGKFRAWLDSGANGVYVQRGSGHRQGTHTQIGTANRDSSLSATHVGVVELQTKTGYKLPEFDNVIFSSELRDNLVSVGRVCEGGHSIVLMLAVQKCT